MARTGQGRRSGFRTIVAYRAKGIAVFIYGFAKSERDNIGKDDLDDLKAVASGLLTATQTQIERALELGELVEVSNDEGLSE